MGNKDTDDLVKFAKYKTKSASGNLNNDLGEFERFKTKSTQLSPEEREEYEGEFIHDPNEYPIELPDTSDSPDQDNTDNLYQSLKNIAGDAFSGALEVPGRFIEGITGIPSLVGEAGGLFSMSPKRMLMNALSGFMQGGRQFANIPSNTAQYLAKNNLVNQGTADSISGFTNKFFPEDFDYNQAFGIEGNQKGDSILQGLARIIPAIAFSGGSAVGTSILNSAGRNENIVTDAGASLVPGAIKKVGSKVLGTAKSVTPTAALKELTEAGETVKRIKDAKYDSLYADARKAGSGAMEVPLEFTKEAIAEFPSTVRKTLNRALENPNLKTIVDSNTALKEFNRSITRKSPVIDQNLRAESWAMQNVLNKAIKSELFKVGGKRLVELKNQADEFFKSKYLPYEKSGVFDNLDLTDSQRLKKIASSKYYPSNLAQEYPNIRLANTAWKVAGPPVDLAEALGNKAANAYNKSQTRKFINPIVRSTKDLIKAANPVTSKLPSTRDLYLASLFTKNQGDE